MFVKTRAKREGRLKNLLYILKGPCMFLIIFLGGQYELFFLNGGWEAGEKNSILIDFFHISDHSNQLQIIFVWHYFVFVKFII